MNNYESVKGLQTKLKQILDDNYCGVALGFDASDNEFIIYRWGDAPVSSEILGFGATINEALQSYDTWYQNNTTKTGKYKKKRWHHKGR